MCTHLTIPLSSAVALLFINKATRATVIKVRPKVYVDSESAVNYIQYAVSYNWRIGWIECDVPIPLMCSNMLRCAIETEPSALMSLLWTHNRCMTDILLMQCVKIKHLILPKNRHISDNGLIGLTTLETLDFSHNKQITDIALLSKPMLRKVVILHNQRITDMAFKDCESLEYLNLGYNYNTNLTMNFIKNNKKLIELHFYHKRRLYKHWFDKLLQLKQIIAPRSIFI
jgi:hypothetical protein